MGSFERNVSHAGKARRVLIGAVAEARQTHALLPQPVQIVVGADDARCRRIALVFLQEIAVLVNERMAVPRQVCSGLARAGPTVEAGGNALGGLRGAQEPTVIGLADGDVAGRQVDEDIGAG